MEEKGSWTRRKIGRRRRRRSAIIHGGGEAKKCQSSEGLPAFHA